MYKTILVPVDLDEMALTQAALHEVNALAAQEAIQICLLYVMQVPDRSLSRLNKETLRFEDILAAECMDKMQALAKTLDLSEPSSVSCQIRKGSIYDEVLKEVAEIGADLIVIGSRRPSMSTYLLGSNATKIVRYATTSVLVVR